MASPSGLCRTSPVHATKGLEQTVANCDWILFVSCIEAQVWARGPDLIMLRRRRARHAIGSSCIDASQR